MFLSHMQKLLFISSQELRPVALIRNLPSKSQPGLPGEPHGHSISKSTTTPPPSAQIHQLSLLLYFPPVALTAPQTHSVFYLFISLRISSPIPALP